MKKRNMCNLTCGSVFCSGVAPSDSAFTSPAANNKKPLAKQPAGQLHPFTSFLPAFNAVRKFVHHGTNPPPSRSSLIRGRIPRLEIINSDATTFTSHLLTIHQTSAHVCMPSRRSAPALLFGPSSRPSPTLPFPALPCLQATNNMGGASPTNNLVMQF